MGIGKNKQWRRREMMSVWTLLVHHQDYEYVDIYRYE